MGWLVADLLGTAVVGSKAEIDMLLKQDINGEQMASDREKWTAEAKAIDQLQILKCSLGHSLRLVMDVSTNPYRLAQYAYNCDGDHPEGEAQSHHHVAPFFNCRDCWLSQQDNMYTQQPVGFGKNIHPPSHACTFPRVLKTG